MKNAKRYIALVCLAALLLSLGACGKTGENGSGGLFDRKPEGSFRLAVCEMPDSLNPIAAHSATASEFFLLVYDPLWRMDENYEPQPCLVESWDLSSDGLVWTIRLRQDVYFNDPDPELEAPVLLTASDVKFSYELFMRYADDYDRYFDGIRSIDCPDSSTVVITTDYVKGDMLYNPTPILPRYLWSAYATDPESMDNSALVGTGPFLYQSEEILEGEVQKSWTFLANEDYFGGSPALAELCFVYEEIPNNAAMKLLDGQVDACMGLTEAQLLNLQDMTGVECFETQGPGRGYHVLAMNTQSGPLADERVRQALVYALDRDKIFSVALGSVGVSGHGFADPGSDYYLEGAGESVFNKEQAALLLQMAGYADYDGDGILESMDNTMELSFTLYSTLNDAWVSAAQTIFSADLEELGVKIRWVTQDAADISSVCKKGGKWDLYMTTRSSGIDPQYAAAAFAGGQSETGWQSETYDSLYERFVAAVDREERVELCRQMQREVLDEAPYVVLGYGYDIQAIRPDLWTGYQQAAAAMGGLFGTGSASVYMELRPRTEADAEESPAPESTEAPAEAALPPEEE